MDSEHSGYREIDAKKLLRGTKILQTLGVCLLIIILSGMLPLPSENTSPQSITPSPDSILPPALSLDPPNHTLPAPIISSPTTVEGQGDSVTISTNHTESITLLNQSTAGGTYMSVDAGTLTNYSVDIEVNSASRREFVIEDSTMYSDGYI